jgi:hypothetical protein
MGKDECRFFLEYDGMNAIVKFLHKVFQISKSKKKVTEDFIKFTLGGRFVEI